MNNDASSKDEMAEQNRIVEDAPYVKEHGSPTKAEQSSAQIQNNINRLEKSKPIMSHGNLPSIDSPSKLNYQGLNGKIDLQSNFPNYVQTPQQHPNTVSLTQAASMLPSTQGPVSSGNSLLYPELPGERMRTPQKPPLPQLSMKPSARNKTTIGNDIATMNAATVQQQYQPNSQISQHQPIQIPASSPVQSHSRSAPSVPFVGSNLQQNHSRNPSTGSVPNLQNAVHFHSGQINQMPVAPQFTNVQQQQQQQQQQQFTHQPNPTEQFQPQLNQKTGSTSTPTTTLSSQNETDILENIIQSPKTETEIVERSPGGRYLRFSEKLGSGAYKNVYRAYDTNEGIEVAWNAVNLSGVPKTERARVVNEVHLLERLHHSNIISFHGSWVNREKEQVIFVTEILSSGTLKQFVNKVQVIRWRIAKRWAIQILKGLEYLHNHDPPIIHRDVKCDNIFINGTSGDLRIGDLGLSTAIGKSTKTLSVLGTPEFMAPELYEECYDEKVDIYAFGMCMLEIFTKEVPYRECSNPAQIYKKVSNGILPESLARIKNTKAQDFIKLCLGANDGNLVAYRPSASELLTHPFLEPNDDDESEVEVDPPLNENIISEIKISNDSVQKSPYGLGSNDSITSPRITGVAMHDSNSIPVADNLNVEKQPRKDPQSTAQVIGSDDNEREQISSMKQQYYSIPTEQGVGVIVTQLPVHLSNTVNNLPETDLLGRGQGTKDDAGAIPLQNTFNQIEPILSTQNRNSVAMESQLANPGPASSAKTDTKSVPQQYSSSMEENDDSQQNKETNDEQYLVFAAVIEEVERNPYDDDVMKLIITLPVEGKTQNVQFDFHLVEDDPVQVAREMVRELSIPESALLEISETISGLARSARIRQGRQTQRSAIVNQQLIDPQQSLLQLSPPHAGVQPNLLREVNSAPFLLDDNLVQPSNTDMGQNIQAPALVYQDTGESIVPTHFTSIGEMPEPLPQAAAAALQSHLHEHQIPTNVANMQSQVTNTVPLGHKTTPLQSVGSIHDSTPLNTDVQETNNQETPLISLSPETTTNVLPSQNQILLHSSTNRAVESNNVVIPDKLSTSPTVTPDLSTFEQFLLKKDISSNDLSSKKDDLDDGHTSDSSDISNSSEMRRLREDYQKHLKRAERAYLTRRDNLIRSKEEKEAQHLKTLEKHEKEKADFERRLKLAEEEQNKRLRKLEKEWEKKVRNAKAAKEMEKEKTLHVSLSPTKNDPSERIGSKLMDDVAAMNTLAIDQTSGKGHGDGDYEKKA